MDPLQLGAPDWFGLVVAVVGLYLGLAAFLSLTAFVAARNVLGDVPVQNALLVGPVPALASFLQGAVPVLREGPLPLLLAALALALDFAAIRWAYDVENRMAAYVTFVHAIVSVIMAVILVGVAVLVLGQLAGGGPG